MIMAIIGDDKEKGRAFVEKQDQKKHSVYYLIPDVEYDETGFKDAYAIIRDCSLVVAVLNSDEATTDGVEALLAFAKLFGKNIIFL